jgi:uncharacterized protein YdeI (YjbR/CyaY-like superfamily)
VRELRLVDVPLKAAAVFFADGSAFRRWLEKHHDTLDEQWVGFYKRDSGKPSLTWPQAVDAALCFGWIDGLRKSIDTVSYQIRFTRRRATSRWSVINIRRVSELIATGEMRPAGLAVYESRKIVVEKYSYEHKKDHKLSAAYQRRVKANKAAWSYLQSQAPWYQRVAAFWVMSAKKEETRERRLAALIADSAAGRSIAPVRAGGKR